MRRFLAVIFTVIYVSVSVEFTLSYHYCMDELVAVGMVTGHSDATCPECGMAGNAHDCCSQTEQPVRLAVDQSAAASFVFAFQSQLLHIPLLFNAGSAVVSDLPAIRVVVSRYTPLPLLSTPLFIRDCVYLI